MRFIEIPASIFAEAREPREGGGKDFKGTDATHERGPARVRPPSSLSSLHLGEIDIKSAGLCVREVLSRSSSRRRLRSTSSRAHLGRPEVLTPPSSRRKPGSSARGPLPRPRLSGQVRPAGHPRG